MEQMELWLKWAVELQALAQAGLQYGHDKFDFERYERIRDTPPRWSPIRLTCR